MLIFTCNTDGEEMEEIRLSGPCDIGVFSFFVALGSNREESSGEPFCVLLYRIMSPNRLTECIVLRKHSNCANRYFHVDAMAPPA